MRAQSQRTTFHTLHCRRTRSRFESSVRIHHLEPKRETMNFLNDFQWMGLINPTYSQIGATGSHSDRTAVHHRTNEGGIAVVARRFQWTHHRTHRSFQPIRSLAETKRSVNGHASLRSQPEF